MKRPLLAGLALVALMGVPALAADMPGRALPLPRTPTFVPFFSWNGLYAGINAGYGFGDSNWTGTTTGTSTGNFSVSGALIGGTLGYNLQLSSIVLGVEGDLGWSNIKGSTTTLCPGGCETSNGWLGTARGRVGLALDHFMPYFTGGAAFGEIKGTSGGSFSDNNVGWTAGAGLEYAFLDNWSAKIEYLYVDLGKATCGTGCSAALPFDVSFTSNIVRGGLNYKFSSF